MDNNNTGIENSGDNNSGDNNSGDNNSGHSNSGDNNSGHGNSGYGNSGYGNSTNRESGMFNSEEPTIRMFNKPTKLKWNEIIHPHSIEFYLTKWIPETEMTDEEQKAYPNFSVRQGYLKKFEYKEAWSNFWRDTDQENKKKFLDLPNFDVTVFEEITGIKIGEPTLSGKKVSVELDGKKYTATID